MHSEGRRGEERRGGEGRGMVLQVGWLVDSRSGRRLKGTGKREEEEKEGEEEEDRGNRIRSTRRRWRRDLRAREGGRHW